MLFLTLLTLVSAIWIQKPLRDSALSVSFCGSNNSFVWDEYTISPDPPVRGSPLNILVKGSLSHGVSTGSTSHVTVKMGLIKIYDTTSPLCDQIGQVDKVCPLEKGPLVINKTVDLPELVPFAHYYVHLDVFNADSSPITCANIVLDMTQ